MLNMLIEMISVVSTLRPKSRRVQLEALCVQLTVRRLPLTAMQDLSILNSAFIIVSIVNYVKMQVDTLLKYARFRNRCDRICRKCVPSSLTTE